MPQAGMSTQKDTNVARREIGKGDPMDERGREQETPQAQQPVAPVGSQTGAGAEQGASPEAPLAREQFGERTARQVGAFMEEGRPEAHIDHWGDRPKQIDWREKLAAMDFDERVDAALASLKRRTTFRDILYGLLDFCMEERPYEEIEPYVESFVEFHRNRQSPRRYVQVLLRTGALEEIELDEQGEPITDEARNRAVEEGLDPDDLDTLVFDWRVVTTDVGRAAYERFTPSSRIADLIGADPEREAAFVDIMAFCRKSRFMGQIVDEFAGKAYLGIDEENRLPRQPSAYVEKLDRAGAVFWDGKCWTLTEEGETFLQERGA